MLSLSVSCSKYASAVIKHWCGCKIYCLPGCFMLLSLNSRSAYTCGCTISIYCLILYTVKDSYFSPRYLSAWQSLSKQTILSELMITFFLKSQCFWTMKRIPCGTRSCLCLSSCLYISNMSGHEYQGMMNIVTGRPWLLEMAWLMNNVALVCLFTYRNSFSIGSRVSVHHLASKGIFVRINLARTVW